MFVLTVDQVDSRHTEDRVTAVVQDAARLRGAGAVLGPDRTAGDEFQLVTTTAGPALRIALELHRTAGWSIGIGVGTVAGPLPPTTREATGAAFLAARAAVEEAKRSVHRLAVAADADPVGAEDVTALVRLLLEVRGRRSVEGWEVADLVAGGLSQAAVAAKLGVTAQAVSLRARAAGVRLERQALPALERALDALDRRASPRHASLART